MAQEQVIILIRVADDAATDALTKAAQAAEELADETQKAGDEAEDAGKKTDRWATVLTGLASGVELAKQGLGLLASGVQAVGGVLAGTVDAYRTQEAATRSLTESLVRAGVESDALAGKVSDLTALAADFADRTSFNDEAIFEGLSKYIQLTGQAAVTTDDLSIILGIAARQQIEVKDAAEQYGRVIKGDIGAVIDLVGITKDQEAALDSLPTSAAKAAAAQKLLAESYKGAAEEGNANFQALKNLSDASTDLTQKVGEVIVESGIFQVVLQPLTKILRGAEGAIDDNKGALQGYILDGVDLAIDAVQDLSGVIARNADTVAGLVTVVRLAFNAWRAFLNVIEIVQKVVAAFVTGALAGLVEGLALLIDGAAAAARAIDSDLAPSLEAASAGAREVSETFAGLSIASLEGAAGDIDDISDSLTNMGAALDDTLPLSKRIAEGAGVIGVEAAKSRLQVQELRKELGKGGAEHRRDKPPAPPPEVPQDAAKAEEARRKRFEEQIAGIRLAALEAQDRAARAQLELNASLLEIERDRLEGNARLLATAQATVDYQTKIRDLAKESAELAAKEAEEEKKRREEALAAIEAQIDAEAALNDEITARLDAFAAGEGGVNKVAAAAARLNEALGKSAAISQRLNAGLITGAQAAQQAIGVAGQATVTFADQLGASAATQAGLLALFETAAALASFAVGDIAGGAQHAAAAALYGVVAGTSAASSGGGSASAAAPAAAGVGGGATGGGAGEDSARRGAQILAEELAARGQDNAPLTVVFDYRGSIQADSASGQRELYRRVQAGGAMEGADFRRLTDRRGGQ